MHIGKCVYSDICTQAVLCVQPLVLEYPYVEHSMSYTIKFNDCTTLACYILYWYIVVEFYTSNMQGLTSCGALPNAIITQYPTLGPPINLRLSIALGGVPTLAWRTR